MARGPSTFKQQNVTRALKGAVKAGLKIGRVEIDRNGKIVLVIGEDQRAASPENEWDAVLSR